MSAWLWVHMLIHIALAISVPFYVLFVYIIIRNRRVKPFNSAFYKLSRGLAVVDLLLILHLIIFHKLRAVGYLQWPFRMWPRGVLPHIAYFDMGYLMNVQHFTGILLAFNRFSCIVTPKQHAKVWKPKPTLICCALQFAVPFMFSICDPVLYNQQYYVFDNRSSHWTWKFDVNNGYFLVVRFVYYLTATVTSAGLYLCAFVTICFKQRMKSTPLVRKLYVKTEVRLTMAGLVIFITMSINCFVLSLASLDLALFNSFRWIWLYSLDLFSICNPYLLCAFSPTLRYHVIRMLCCHWSTPGVSSVSAQLRALKNPTQAVPQEESNYETAMQGSEDKDESFVSIETDCIFYDSY